MNPKLFLCLALVLSGTLFGCSTAYHPVVCRQTNILPLYVYWGSGDYGSATRFLSARIHLGEAIFVGGDDFMDLKGHIEQRDTNLVADLVGSTGQQSQFYRGNLTLEEPSFAQGGAASGGAGPAYWFLVSTNLDCRAVLKHVNAVRGWTNLPFNHPVRIFTPPAIPQFPKQIDPATGLPWDSSSLDPSTGLPMTQKQSKNERAKSFFKDRLAQCGTNEIICLWFLRDDPQIGMVMSIDLNEESVTTVRDVFDWAFQNFETRKLSHSQILNLKK